MNLKVQKRLAAQILKCSEKRIVFHEERLDEIKESITRDDVRGLIQDRAIICTPKKGVSRVRANKRLEQYRKGRRKGPGSKKGKANTHLPKKESWMNAVRLQRAFVAILKDKGHITKQSARDLYRKVKGGFFRNKRHIKLFAEEKNLFKNGKR